MLFGIPKTAIEVIFTFVTCGAKGTLYVLILGLVIFVLSGLVYVDLLAGAADPPNVKLLDEKEATRKDPFAAIHDKPSSENPTLIPQLMAAANRLPPQYLYELSRRLWETDKHAAMEWFVVGKARALYDAQRCVDTTARQGIQILPMIAPDVMKGIEADRKAYGDAGLRALARPDIFLDTESPVWICSHGMGAVMSGIQNKPMKESDWLRPPAEWEGIKNELRKELTQYFIEQG